MAQLQVVNLGRKPLWIPMTTGESLCVGPGESSNAIEDVLLRPSDAIDRLVHDGAIRIVQLPSQLSGVTS